MKTSIFTQSTARVSVPQTMLALSMTGSKQTGKNNPHFPFPTPHSPSLIKTLTPFPTPHSPSPIKRGMAAAFWAVVLFMVMAVTAQAQVCQIGATNYATLDAALTAHTNGQTIRLLANINHNTVINVSGKTLIFDLNGKTLNVHNPATGVAFFVTSAGRVDITGAGELNASNTSNNWCVSALDGSRVTVTSISGTGTSGGGAVASAGSEINVRGNVAGLSGVYATTGGQITIDGTLTSYGIYYIQLGSIYKTAAQYEPVTTKAGYLTYSDGTSTVWVKGETPAPPVCEIGATKYTTLSAALTAHTNGQTIRLLDNIEHNTTITISGKTITFDLNGKNLDVSVSSGYGLNVRNGGIVNQSGSGNFNVSSSSDDAVYVNGNGSKATVTNATSTGAIDRAGAYASSGGEITILSSAVGTGSVGFGVYATGGKVTVENASGTRGVCADGNGSQITVRNATATGSGGRGVVAQSNGEVTVLGDLTASGSGSIGAYALVGGQITIDGTITVSGGATYIQTGSTNKTAAQYETTTTKAGYLTYTDGTSTVWVKGETPAAPVCEIGATKYTTLAAALTAHTNGQTIRLLDNIEHNTGIVINGKTITFDLNGKNLDVSSSSEGGLDVRSGGIVNLSGSGNFNVSSPNINNGVYVAGVGSKATVTNAYCATNSSGVTAANGGEITVLGAATSTGSTSAGAYASGGGKVTVENASGGKYGALASGSGSQIIVRNATATGSNGYGVSATSNSEIIVLGDVSASGSGSIGASASTGGKITVDGTITVSGGATYITVGTTAKTAAQYEATTTKAGYLTYTDGTNTVWVKGETPAAPVCEIGATKYTTLSAALAAHTNGQTIRLLDNIEHNTTITINGKTITFDLNGKNLDVPVSSGMGLNVSNGGIVNMSGSGNFNVTSPNSAGVYVTGSGSKATVTNATSTAGGAPGANAGNGGEITVLGTATGSGSNGVGAYSTAGGKITVENASGGKNGVDATGNGSQVTVRNATATGSGGFGVYVSINGEVTVLGDVSASGSGSIGAYANTGGKITIDGTITASGGATYIRTGSTDKTAAQYEATTTKAGYLTYTDGTNTVWVKGEAANYVCEIVQTGTKYASLLDALSAHTNGQTIRLLDNIDYNTEIHISGKTITFDLNGKNLNVNNPAAVGYGLYVRQGGVVKLNGNGAFNITSFHGVTVAEAGSSAVVTNVTATGSYGHGVFASVGEIEVLGNVSAVSNSARAADGGRVTINGAITAGNPYINIQGRDMALNEYTLPTTKAGYTTYTNGTSTIWVKGEPAPAPVISSHPSNQTINAGQTASFAITATGATSYQWLASTNNGASWTALTDGGNISGSRTTTLTVTNVSPYWTGYQFRCEASNTAGSVLSNIATLTVNAPPSPPVFTTQPTDQTITEGESVSFTATATGAASYQWFVSAGAGISFVQITDNSIFSGATTSTLTLTNVPLSYNGYRFGCTATNAAGGSAGSVAATLTVNPAASTSMLSLSATSLDFTTAGGQLSFDITSNTSWEVNSSATWLTVSPASGTGDGTVRVTVAANTANNARTATITISGFGISAQTIIVTQEGTVSNDELRIMNYELRGWMANGTLNVSGLIAGKPWSVYSIGGQLVYTSIATDDKASIRLSTKGIYIIVQENRRAKVINN